MVETFLGPVGTYKQIGLGVILALEHRKTASRFSLIFSDSFTPQAGFGAAIGWGVKRGVYSNEAAQGTGTHAAAAAQTEHPAEQGLVGYIWNLGDIGVGIMAWINILGILVIYFMARPTMLCLRDYEAQLTAGGPITFDTIKLGIKNATFWEQRLAQKK